MSPTARATLDPPPDGGYPNDNTTEGDSAAFDLNTDIASDNTAIGFDAMHFATEPFFNTAVGSQAMEFAGSVLGNVAIGFEALFQDGGDDNTAIGTSAMGLNGLGSNNTAMGEGALFFNDNGNSDACLGANSLANNTTGSSNIALGESAERTLPLVRITSISATPGAPPSQARSGSGIRRTKTPSSPGSGESR